MKRYLIVALIALLGVFSACVPAWAGGFVKWADSTYTQTRTDSTFYWSKHDSTYTDVNTGDTLLQYVPADTLWTLPIGWITVASTDTIYHFCHTGDSIIIVADTTIVLADTMFVVADTTILTASDLVKRKTQWTFIEGITDSLVSEPFGMTSGDDVWTRSVLIGVEILDGAADSMFAVGKALMASSPICGSLPDSEFAYDYGTTIVIDSNDSPGIGSPSVFDLDKPPRCAKVVLKGYGDNAVATPKAHYGAGTEEGTKVRVWIYNSREPISSYQQDSDTTGFDITKTQAAATYLALADTNYTVITAGYGITGGGAGAVTVALDTGAAIAISGNWVNTAHPWADNEVADDITCSGYLVNSESDAMTGTLTAEGIILPQDSTITLGTATIYFDGTNVYIQDAKLYVNQTIGLGGELRCTGDIRCLTNNYRYSVADSFTVGTGNQGTGAITYDITRIAVGSANNDVTLPTAVSGLKILVINDCANTINVFPASGDAHLGQAANAAIDIATTKTYEFIALNDSAWVLIVLE